MTKAIIFDLGGVLFTNGSDTFRESLSHRYNIPLEKVKEVMEGEIGSSYRGGNISRDQFWNKVIAELNIQADINALEDEWINGYVLIEETRDVIFDLAKKHKVYYLSDNVKERAERLNMKYSFLKWFEDGIFSHHTGVRKPHPKLYQLILEKAGVAGKEAVYVDDKEVCLPPAQNLGITTILFKNPKQLRTSLIQLQVL